MNNFFNFDEPLVIIFLILIIGFTIATIFIIVKYFLQKKNQKKLAIEIENNVSTSVFVNKESINENFNNTNTQFNETLKSTIKMDNPDLTKVGISENNTTQIIKNERTSNITNEFYMTKPVSDYFPESAKSASPDGTIYKFTITNNPKIATYQLHTLGAPINEIIKRSETYILPGCDEDNIATLQTRSIITIKSGTVCLENNKWKILNKAIIKYE